MSLWKKFDLSQTVPHYLETGDDCYYAREYISKGGFSASQTNGLISNFKKGIDKKNTLQWQHKLNAIVQFAEELSRLLKDGTIVATVPASKSKNDPEYDSRLDDVLKKLGKLRPTLHIVEPLRVKKTLPAVHLGGDRKSSIFYNNLEWLGGLPIDANHLVLVDDVITTGSHFKACQKMVLENVPTIKVFGIFWAKTIWPDRDESPKLL